MNKDEILAALFEHEKQQEQNRETVNELHKQLCELNASKDICTPAFKWHELDIKYILAVFNDLWKYQEAEKENFIRRCGCCGSLEMEPLRFDDKKGSAVLYVCHDCEGAVWLDSLPVRLQSRNN